MKVRWNHNLKVKPSGKCFALVWSWFVPSIAKRPELLDTAKEIRMKNLKKNWLDWSKKKNDRKHPTNSIAWQPRKSEFSVSCASNLKRFSMWHSSHLVIVQLLAISWSRVLHWETLTYRRNPITKHFYKCTNVWR